MNEKIAELMDITDFYSKGWDENYSRPAVLHDGRLAPVYHNDYVMDKMDFKTLDEWVIRKKFLKEQILISAGLWPMPAKCELNPRIYDRVEYQGFTIEKVVFESYPGFFVTGNLYRPTGSNKKYPALLNPHGHWKNGRLEHSELTDIPLRCANFALMGFISFTYDMIGFKDSRQISHLYGGYLQDLWCFGAFGIQLWNSIRCVDFLESLPDVDTGRIGCTGASGGGTQTFFLSAVDERIKVSAPVNMISKHMQGGCNCEIAPFLHIGTDNLELAALMAPRPMYLISSTRDWTKDTPIVEYPEILSIYKLFDKESELEYFHQDAEHNYNKKARTAAYNWFARKLSGKDLKWEEVAVDFGDIEKLSTLPLPESPVKSNDDLFRLQSKERTDALERLWNENFENTSFIIKTELRHITGVSEEPDEISLLYSEIAETDNFVIKKEIIGTRQKGENIPVSIVRHKKDSAAVQSIDSELNSSKITLVFHPEGKKALYNDSKWYQILIDKLDNDNMVISADLFLTGEYHRPGSKSGRDTGSCNHFTTFNYTDDALRVQDVVTIYNYIRRNFSGEINLIAIGSTAAVSLAALPFISGLNEAALDFGSLRFRDESDYPGKFYIPGFLSAGGFKSCIRLADTKKITLFNLDKDNERDFISSCDVDIIGYF